MGMLSLQRRVLKISLETSHFIPFPTKVPEQNRLSFDETGSGVSEHFCYKKIPGGAAKPPKGFVSI